MADNPETLLLLDTDHLSLLQRGGSESETLRERLKLVAPDDYGVTIITYMEQVEGRLAEINKAQTPAAQTAAFLGLHETLTLYQTIAVWDFTPQAAALFFLLRSQKIRVGTQDLRIACIALANNATLLTRNQRDFERIPGLTFEDWTR
ncbi:type II toxin-antitoxin system VapC family toxin [Armatimonas sp.]|uniref:type II toxin-antitoxin system VapC family toxin n=1 Tax=Armatimonas sp. TaxID=1872638 RepID=UPI003750AE60